MSGGSVNHPARCALLLLLVPWAGACEQPRVAAVPPDAPRAAAGEYHERALEIAQWLEAAAMKSDLGWKWPRLAPWDPKAASESSPAAAAGAGSSGAEATSLYSGSCGPILFFLELAFAEDELRHGALEGHARRTIPLGPWLDVACLGADELLATLPEKCVGEGCGLYTGIAGVGFTLEQVGRATGEPKYLDGARRCVELLHAAARVAGSGIEWSDTTDMIAGSAGIGSFLLAYHDAESDPEGGGDPQGAALAFELATRAGRRLLDLSQREAVGRSWRMDPAFPRVMPNFSHGTAGIAWFLARLHASMPGAMQGATRSATRGATPEAEVATGAATPFLDAARDGAEHLLAIADRADAAGGGCRIHHHTPDGTDLYYLGWCHGPCGTARLFLELAASTGEPEYADAARGCVRSVMASGLPQQRLPGFWNNVGVCCGSAGVVGFMLERARATGDSSCARFAVQVADDLLARGTRDEHGLSFVHAEHRTKPGLLEAQTGYMQGAAGVGLALLDLAAFERGAPCGLRLPDAR